PLFCFADPAPSSIHTLSLHDALPISLTACAFRMLHFDSDIIIFNAVRKCVRNFDLGYDEQLFKAAVDISKVESFRTCHIHFSLRSEEHTSELQSRFDLVCRLLLEKKK